MKPHYQTMRLAAPLAAVLVVSTLGTDRAVAQTITEIIDATGDGTGNVLGGPNGMAVDAAGNAYVAGLVTDNAFKIAPAPDCNGNGIPDECDLADGTSLDCNINETPDECDIADGTLHDDDGSGVADECEAAGDLDGDGSVGITDLLIVLANWGPCPPKGACPADLNGDGTVGILDLLALLSNWG